MMPEQSSVREVAASHWTGNPIVHPEDRAAVVVMPHDS
jgi:hypothetical protein